MNDASNTPLGPDGRPITPQAAGTTTAQQQPAGSTTVNERSVPRLPNERDLSADAQEQQQPGARAMGELALDDIESGRVDTDRGPVADQVYRNAVKQP